MQLLKELVPRKCSPMPKYSISQGTESALDHFQAGVLLQTLAGNAPMRAVEAEYQFKESIKKALKQAAKLHTSDCPRKTAKLWLVQNVSTPRHVWHRLYCPQDEQDPCQLLTCLGTKLACSSEG